MAATAATTQDVSMVGGGGDWWINTPVHWTFVFPLGPYNPSPFPCRPTVGLDSEDVRNYTFNTKFRAKKSPFFQPTVGSQPTVGHPAGARSAIVRS
jgi:hypothetical protein